MTTTFTPADLARLTIQAMQTGARLLATEAGLPQSQYQKIVLSRKWREAMKAARAELDRQYKPKKGKTK